jgi:3-hydroxyisobutyrate dehydrogenase-like beta-hydroxyacid dehydrogenase
MSEAARRVSFCGLGNLGAPICAALVASVHTVRAYDPRPEALGPLVTQGAIGCASPADAARDAEVHVVMVRDDTQALACVTGHDGILTTARVGSVLVSHSTVAPETVETLAAACAAAAVGFVDAGISRGAGRPIGNLYAMCGGAAATIDAVRPVVDVYCSDVVRFGEVGAGMRAKLIRNALRYAMFGALYEGMVLAEAAGLDLGAMAQLYRGTFGMTFDDEVVISRPTMRPIALDDPAADREFLTRMSAAVTLGWKDLDDAFLLAREFDLDLPVARAARPLFGPALGLALYESDLGQSPSGS